MKPYEVLEHTADLRIRATGKTLKALFVNALAGMMDYLKNFPLETDLPPAAKMIRRAVKISSPDLNALLVDFLSEALTLADTNREVYREAEFLKFPSPAADSIQKKTGNVELEAQLFGEKVKWFNRDIKAVTYHRLDIKQNKEGFWEATIVFDI